ncbi:hypothetical protein [Kitasatospora sp. NPDC056531]|uniref:hypothetical protein n=1 Tax=Kitasatospora sp. NPDC056531 TaxID=3345856 RepID=UPI0036A10D07
MRFTVTPYDDHGTPTTPQTVDLPALRALLTEAATTGRRLHIRPQPPAPGDGPHDGPPPTLTSDDTPHTLDILNT